MLKSSSALVCTITLALFSQLSSYFSSSTDAFTLSESQTDAARLASPPQRSNEVFITEMELARDDGAGRSGQTVKGFKAKDNPIHCLVTLSRPAEGTHVRFVWTVLEAGGKSNEVLAATEIETKSGEIVADGLLRLPREWPKGRYRVQATVNRSASRTLDFQIE